MSVHQFDSLPRYVRFLQENPQEVELLYKELLIGVTNFFRDPRLFDLLKNKAIPQLLQDRQMDGSVRVWNPGCSTGEGTLAIAFNSEICDGKAHDSGLPTTSTKTP
jgi:two-component system CheB/CheR fusion protein